MNFRYYVIQQVGQGAYGCVWKAIDNVTKEIVAIKHLKSKSIATSYENGARLAEVDTLEALKGHSNIVQLKEVIKQNGDLFYVFEYLPQNLLQVIKDRRSLPSEVEIQSWMYQILKGVAYMHSKGYVHRDLKPENVLAKEGTMKIADFGLSKKMKPCRENISTHPHKLEYCGKVGCTCGCVTTYVCTRWYRAPEIILGSPSYSTASDMWSVGVILAEMFRALPIFPGTSERNQLDQISEILGAPNDFTWPEGYLLANNCNFEFKKNIPLVNLARYIPNASYAALDLIKSLMVWDPQKRITALQALKHPFFRNKSRSYQSNPIFTSNHIPFSMIHHQLLPKQAHNLSCAMENNEEQQRFAHNKLHTRSIISSYQQACNFIQANSIVR